MSAIKIYFVKWDEYEDDDYERITITNEQQSDTFFEKESAEDFIEELENAKFDGCKIGNIRLIEEDAAAVLHDVAAQRGDIADLQRGSSGGALRESRQVLSYHAAAGDLGKRDGGAYEDVRAA